MYEAGASLRDLLARWEVGDLRYALGLLHQELRSDGRGG